VAGWLVLGSFGDNEETWGCYLHCSWNALRPRWPRSPRRKGEALPGMPGSGSAENGSTSAGGGKEENLTGWRIRSRSQK
jgi:hypothetical protein